MNAGVQAALAARRQQAINRLAYFALHAWAQVEPGRRLTWNWHITQVCDELQEFTRVLWDPTCRDLTLGQELVVCVPPRSLKSYLIGVCLHAWLWLHSPWVQYQGLSNGQDLAERDSLRALQLITSPWYQALVRQIHVQRGGRPDDALPWGIDNQQAKKVNYWNDRGGLRQALGMDSNVTGKGADLQALDDPLDAKKATRGSPAAVRRRMEQVEDDYDNVLRSRLNDPARSLRLVVMQRLDTNDLAGVLIRRGCRSLVLPMEYDPAFPDELGGVNPRDRRTQPGQLLMPQRWTPELWASMTADGAAQRHVQAQYNQRPTLPDGGLFRLSYMQREFAGAPWALRVDEHAIFVDCSFKGADTSSHVVMQVWGRRGKAWFAMLDQVRAQLDFAATVDALLRLRSKWATTRRVVIEDKANGPAVISLLKRDVPGLIAWNPGTASKYERAQIGSAPAMQAGQVHYPAANYAPWLPGYRERHVAFDGSGSVPDDEIDTTSMALLYWTGGGLDPLARLKKQFPSLG